MAPEISRVWLFGSRAKGEARDDSDVDLAVELDPSEIDGDEPLIYWAIRGEALTELLQVGVPCRVDCYLLHPDNPIVWRCIEGHGVVLFEKSSRPPS